MRLLRLLKRLLIVVAILACAGAVYQHAANAWYRYHNPPPGQLVDVGGYRMHLDCTGRGSPTVILESGLADTWLAWYKVQPAISRFTRVCSYDRAGMGWSDPSPKSRDAKTIAGELHTLLHNAKIDPSFVMVGHSLGGFYVRMYANLYPTEVVGMVLIDATHPDQFERLPREVRQFNENFLRKLGWKEDTMPFGIPRLMGWCGNGPPELRPMLRAIDCRLQPWYEHMAEYRAWDINTAQVRAAGTIGDIPLIVLSEDPGKNTNDTWSALQKDLVHLSTNSSQMIAAGSGHLIQIDRPDVVIAAIRKVVGQSADAHRE